MSDFDSAVEYVLKNEKGLEENKHDLGGITNHGISLRFLKSIKIETLRSYGLIVSETIDEDTIRHLTRAEAKTIYYHEFWLAAPFERINNQANCNYIFDMAVNMGIAPAIKCAQRACWSVMKKINVIPEDGILGTLTIEMLNHCEFYLLPAMRSERAGYYKLTSLENPATKEFVHGWLNRAYGV